VYKTLVVLRASRGHPMLIVIPGNQELDLKQTAKEVNEKNIQMAPQREAERLTGLLVGGISPLALLNRGFDVFIDQSALKLEEIYISGGKRGVNLKVKVTDIIKVTGAKPIEATVSGENG
jgi:Cys-tRNA(Pro)/Cys-tRNA(Cys) deacylase